MTPPLFANAISRRLQSVLVAAPVVPAVLFEDQWFTWGDIDSCSRELDRLLTDDGIEQRMPVGVVAANRPGGVAALVGLLSQGRVPVLISPIQPATAISSVVEKLHCAAVIVPEDLCGPELDETVNRLGIEALTVSGEPGLLRAAVRHRARSSVLAEFEHVDEMTALIVPTSGTTGPPKPIPVFWHQLPVPTDGPVRMPADPSERPPIIHALSLATITGVMAITRALSASRSIALLERVDVDKWADLVERFRPRHAGLPPAAMRTILDRKIPAEKFGSLIAWPTGSAPVSVALQREFEETYGVPVLVGYGATELGGSVTGWSIELHRDWAATKMGSVGRAVEGTELRVVDEETGHPVAAGQPGILVVRKPGLAVGDAEGWARTNDRARLDSDGFLYILGRADDVVIRGGFKVSLGELEDLFRTHPAVRDAVAIGRPDARLGEVPVVAVVLRDTHDVTGEELRSWSRERTAPYKVPVQVTVMDGFPMLASHKVDKVAIRTEVGGPDRVTSDQR